MVKDYKDWKTRQMQLAEDSVFPPEYFILHSFYGVVEQYLHSPNSAACKGVLDSAMECVDKWLKERETK